LRSILIALLIRLDVGTAHARKIQQCQDNEHPRRKREHAVRSKRGAGLRRIIGYPFLPLRLKRSTIVRARGTNVIPKTVSARSSEKDAFPAGIEPTFKV
jgi:hypothetical protein